MQAICAWLIFTWLPLDGPASAAEPVGSCVACHKALDSVSYQEHDFADWEKSVHANAGLACEACHGGDAGQKDKAAAHKGMLPSTDAASAVYFSRVPDTCGKCHADVKAAFARSKHSKELKRTGRGPNCVTCHGSMANHIIAPRELEQTCTLCHRKPTQAFAALMSLNHAREALGRLDAALAASKGRNVDAAPQEKERRDIVAALRKVATDWHGFDMPQVLEASQAVSRRAVNAVNELTLKEQQKAP